MKRFSILLIFLSHVGFAQEAKQEALKKFNNQQWMEAGEIYRSFLKKNNGDSLDWYNLAYCELQLKQYDKALEHFEKAEQLNFNKNRIAFNRARVYALKRDEKQMLSVLSSGAKNGLTAYTQLQTDPAFASYLAQGAFQAILNQVKLNAYPCLSNKDNRHFDFWLGEWEVYANGLKVGENYITMAKGGCAIHENYFTSRNYAGQSINFYDPIDKKWHQHWVGSSGDIYNYIETQRAKGMLQFESPFMGPQGTVSLSRLTFTLNVDGTVRQLFESSADDGKTWSVAFDGLYKRKEIE